MGSPAAHARAHEATGKGSPAHNKALGAGRLTIPERAQDFLPAISHRAAGRRPPGDRATPCGCAAPLRSARITPLLAGRETPGRCRLRREFLLCSYARASGCRMSQDSPFLTLAGLRLRTAGQTGRRALPMRRPRVVPSKSSRRSRVQVMRTRCPAAWSCLPATAGRRGGRRAAGRIGTVPHVPHAPRFEAA